MTPLVANSIHYSSLLVVLFDVLVVLFFCALSSKDFRKSSFVFWLGSKALVFSFIVSLGATLGSYFFSNYAGFAPCLLCWYQRIFLFPQVILFGLALWKRGSKDMTVWLYSFGLTLAGLAVALYHYYGQMFNTSALPCAAQAVSCTKREFVEFGYITIPIMSATTFLILIVLIISRWLTSKK